MDPDTPRRRIFVVDDHEAVRDGLRTLIDGSADLRMVGEASSCAEALTRIPATRPDVVLLDLRLPDGDGLDTCREIFARLPGTRVLVLTATADDESQHASKQAGASGHVVKSARRNEILSSIRRVLSGELVYDEFEPAVPTAAPTDGSLDDERLRTLTASERIILDLIIDGLTNDGIAAELQLSHKTVKKQVSAVFVKLGVSTRVGAAVVATRAAQSRHPSSGTSRHALV